jgi:hypothetical protein
MRSKLNYSFKLAKNQEKSGAWLATVEITGDSDAVPEESVIQSAWTSVAPAKRWCAQMINRKSIRWTTTELTTLDPTTSQKVFTADVEVKL